MMTCDRRREEGDREPAGKAQREGGVVAEKWEEVATTGDRLSPAPAKQSRVEA